jgi:negative regulator of flagellin synthesis FlgM
MSKNDKPISGPGPASAAPEADQDRLEGLERKARQVVYQTPEVRPEKVAQVKEAIEAGTYEIDSEKLADILIEELNLKR